MKHKTKRSKSQLSWKHIALASAFAFMTSSAHAGLMGLEVSKSAEGNIEITFETMELDPLDTTYNNATDLIRIESEGGAGVFMVGIGGTELNTGASYLTATSEATNFVATVAQYMALDTVDNTVSNQTSDGGVFAFYLIQGGFICYTTTTVGDSATITFDSTDETAFQNISTAAANLIAVSDGAIVAIPEPATVGLLGLSALVLFGIRRAKRTMA